MIQSKNSTIVCLLSSELVKSQGIYTDLLGKIALFAKNIFSCYLFIVSFLECVPLAQLQGKESIIEILMLRLLFMSNLKPSIP